MLITTIKVKQFNKNELAWNFSLPRIFERASHTKSAEHPDRNPTIRKIKTGANQPDYALKK